MKTKISQSLIAVSCVLGLFISACGNSNGSNGGGGNNSPQATSTLSIGNISTIPVVNGSSKAYFTLQVFNNTTQAVSLQSFNLSNGVDKSIVNTTNCSIIPAQSVCSLGVSAPNRKVGQAIGSLSGTYNLSLNYRSFDKINNYQVQQNISYSDEMVAQKGIYSSNWNNAAIIDGEAKSLSVPLILAEDFTHLGALSRATNVTPTVYCPAGYSKGSSCTMIIPYPQQALQNTISIQGRHVGDSTSFGLLNMVVMAQSSGAYLVNSGANTVINANLGESSATLTLINLGSVAATALSIVADNPAQLTINSSCGASLQVAESCTYQLRMSGATSINNATYKVNYNDGNQMQTSSYNASYVAAAPAAPSVQINVSSNANYTLIGESAVIPFTITNLSSTTLTNLSYTAVQSQNTSLSIISGSNSCVAGQSLANGISCTLYVSYAPSLVESGSFKVTISGNYNSGSTVLSYTAGYAAANYSSISSIAQITANPSSLNFAINANNSESVTESVVFTNIGQVGAQISNITFPNIPGLTSVDLSLCSNKTLAVNESCVVNFTFGPINGIESSASGNVVVNYLTFPTSGAPATTSVAVNTQSTVVALIKVGSGSGAYPLGFYADGPGFITGGAGSQASPFTFSSFLDAMTVHIIYTNNGSESALNFNVNTNASPGLPVAVEVASNTSCATGINTMTLAVGESCVLNLNLLSSAVASLPYDPQPVEFRIPGYSFKGIKNPLNYTESQVVTSNGQSSIYTQPMGAASYSMTTTGQNTTINGDGTQTATITFNVSSFGSGVNSINFAPDISTLQGFSFTNAAGNASGATNCSVTGPGAGSCTLYITAPVYAPYATYYVLYFARMNGDSSDDSNAKVFTFVTHS